MEEVLDLYEEPYEDKRPVVCFDERPCQLLGEVRAPLPPKPGKPKRQDYEYERRGTGNVFGYFEPLAGRREMEVTERRSSQDFARCMRRLVDELYPGAEVIRVVLDNLSSHSKSSLYATFEPEEARRIARKLEFHFTPKHGSWLNAVEIEFAALAKQCLDRRIGDLETLRTEVAAWTSERNARVAKVDWQFTTSDARIKLKRLYPSDLT